MSSPAAFAKMHAAGDGQPVFGVPAKPAALRGKEEQRRERALIFIKNRSKRYKACSDVSKSHENDISGISAVEIELLCQTKI